MEEMGEGMGNDFDDSDDEGITFLATSFNITGLSSGKFVVISSIATSHSKFRNTYRDIFYIVDNID